MPIVRILSPTNPRCSMNWSATRGYKRTVMWLSETSQDWESRYAKTLWKNICLDRESAPFEKLWRKHGRFRAVLGVGDPVFPFSDLRLLIIVDWGRQCWSRLSESGFSGFKDLQDRGRESEFPPTGRCVSFSPVDLPLPGVYPKAPMIFGLVSGKGRVSRKQLGL